MVNTTKKKSRMGCRKIVMKKIDNPESLRVCFSKRRAGLFKKANDLSILCGVEVGIIVFSPAGKPYSFGHPSVASIVERFRSGENNANAGNSSNNMNVHTLIQHHTELLKRIEVEKQRKGKLEEEINAKVAVGEPFIGEDANFDNMNVEEMKGLLKALQHLRRKVAMRNDEIMLQTQNINVPMMSNTNFTGAMAGNYFKGDASLLPLPATLDSGASGSASSFGYHTHGFF